MPNDMDIQKYLEMIKRSRSENQTVHRDIDPNDSISSTNVIIDPTCDIRGIARMKFQKNVVIQKDCWLNIAFDSPVPGPMIAIDEGTNIGRRCTISAANRIIIGKNVLIAPNVLITDHYHEYRHIGIPIMYQGITTHEDQVMIGDESWIGTNSVVMGNVTVGRHCVIGANSVVNKDIPDFSVAVGNPAKIVKIWNTKTGCWDSFDKCLERNLAPDVKSDLRNYVVPFHSLKSLQVEVSSACNLNCPQCFKHIEGHKTGFFPHALWDQRIKPLLPQLEDIHLVGIGEPLLSKDFFRYVEDAKTNNVTVHSTSNLQLLNRLLAENIVTSGLDNLSFSCDGASSGTYESIRIHGKLSVLRKSLGLINAAKDRNKSLFPHLILNFGAMKTNISELPDIVKFAYEHRVGMIIAYHNVAYVSRLKEESLYHAQALSDEYFLRAKELAEKLGIVMFMPGLFSQPIKHKPEGFYCTYPLGHLYIYHDGRVGPCCMDFPDRYILGNINQDSIEEVWNGSPILRLRQSLNTSPSDTCRYCVSHGKMDISDPRYFFRFQDSEEYLNSLPAGNNN